MPRPEPVQPAPPSAVDMYLSGEDIRDTAAAYEMTYCRMRRALLKAGVELRPAGWWGQRRNLGGLA